MQFRVEDPSDYRRVEEITREAFWNLYMPGCDEHFLLHSMRKRPEFVKELSLVAVDSQSSEVVAHIAYCRTQIKIKSLAKFYLL